MEGDQAVVSSSNDDLPTEKKQEDNLKQKMATSSASDPQPTGVANLVAHHYNEVPETGLAVRTQSRIFYMRNFNNWTKSVLIGEFIQLIKQDRPRHVKVLDLCCGKGGDLLKWKKAGIDKLVCVDIAGTSVEQCESRYKESVDRARKERYGPRMFDAEFLVADCTRARLSEMYSEPNLQFNLVSCQFSFHYSFESHQQARRMLQNVTDRLQPGGYFIATTLNSDELVKRWRASETNTFGNDVYNVSFQCEDKTNIPLFGAKYLFYLEGSVMDCPEFLVHFPLLLKLAAEFGLELVYKKPFAEYFAESVQRGDNRALLGKMQAMEPYPNEEDVSLLSTNPDDYSQARDRLEELTQQQADDRRKPKLGTLSKAEWEAVTLYIVCAFRKRGGGADTSPSHAPQKRKHEDDSPPPADQPQDKAPRPV